MCENGKVRIWNAGRRSHAYPCAVNVRERNQRSQSGWEVIGTDCWWWGSTPLCSLIKKAEGRSLGFRTSTGMRNILHSQHLMSAISVPDEAEVINHSQTEKCHVSFINNHKILHIVTYNGKKTHLVVFCLSTLTCLYHSYSFLTVLLWNLWNMCPCCVMTDGA